MSYKVDLLKIHLAALLCAFASGCVSVGHFSNSTASKIATLEVRMTEVPTHFWFYRNGIDCTGGIDVFRGETLASFVAGTAQPLVIEANKELAIEVDGRFHSPLRYCSLTISFFPETSGRYRVYFSKDTKNGPVCGLRVTRLFDEGGAVREVPDPSFKRRVGTQTATGWACVPL